MSSLFRHGLLPLAFLSGPALAQPTFPTRPEPRPVPEARALAEARRALAEQIDGILSRGADPWTTQQALFAAASQTGDDAACYVLMWQAVEIAEGAGSPEALWNALIHLETEFAIDRERLLLDHLRGMVDPKAAPGVAAAVAVTALVQAEQAFRREDEKPMLRFYDTAVRASVVSGDAWLHARVRDDLPRLRSIHRAWRELCLPITDQEERDRLEYRLQQIVLWPEFLDGEPLDQLEPLLRDLPPDLADLHPRQAGPEGLLELARLARHDWVRRSLVRGARQLVSERWKDAGTDAERVAIGRELLTLTRRLADREGITRLSFRSPGDLGQLVLTNAMGGKWRIEDGLLIGTATGNRDFATHRYAFQDMRSVVIRGGIRSAQGQNFRCKIGDVNLLFNWEVKPENHLWVNGQRWEKGPPALEKGKEHTITLHATQMGVLVFVDDVHWWTAPGALSGTVTVYPALGSEIFVREILVDGELAMEGRVAGPRGEPK